MKNKNKIKTINSKDIYILTIPLIGIVIAELNIFFKSIYIGLGLYIINLSIIILVVIFLDLELNIKNVLQSLVLLTIMRIINFSIPQFDNINHINQYILIYGIMFIPIYSLIKNQQISLKELGIDFRRFYIYLPLALIIGYVIAIFEYGILPTSVISDMKISNIIFISTIMMIFIGPAEELIFRSILQTRIEKVLGFRYSILLSGILFGVMHSSYSIVNEILLSIFFGIILGYLFYKTRSLPFLVSIHGSANIILYVIL